MRRGTIPEVSYPMDDIAYDRHQAKAHQMITIQMASSFLNAFYTLQTAWRNQVNQQQEKQIPEYPARPPTSLLCWSRCSRDDFRLQISSPFFFICFVKAIEGAQKSCWCDATQQKKSFSNSYKGTHAARCAPKQDHRIFSKDWNRPSALPPQTLPAWAR